MGFHLSRCWRLIPATALAIHALPASAVRQTAAAHSTDDISSLLRMKTEAFSDAGQRGDGAAMARTLDDRVVFFNEGGDQASRKDMASATPASSPGVTTKMSITDWTCEVHGNVAVASFIDNQQQDFHGQPFHAQYRSVETWLKEGADWRMIGSATVALAVDPPSITLAPAVLDDYSGTYEAAPGVRFTFTRKGGDLLASANNGPQTVQMAEAPDVLFTPGHPRMRKIFQRDAAGKIVAFALRREGHDILFRKVA